MKEGDSLHRLLEQVKSDEIPIEMAEQQIRKNAVGHVSDFAALDLGRKDRCGIPEVVLAEGKDPDHLSAIAENYVKTVGRCIISRIGDDEALHMSEWARNAGVSCEMNKIGRIMVISTSPLPEKTGGVVGIITAGTSDIRVAEEARVIVEEMGCTPVTAYDVGVAGIHRLFPVLEEMKRCHIMVVAAGREGTLPSVIAGLIDRPVIGVPVSTGYGYMGAGRAALASMLQSCSVITVVNIDAGFVAGAFAAQVANMVVKR